MAENVRVKLWLDGGRRFASEVREGAREVRRLGREFKETNRDARGAGDGLGIVQRMIGLIKPAALITGMGLAAGGLSAVAAGGVAVVSALGPLAGALAPAAAGMVALKTATGLVKVAQMGLSASMKGVFADFQKATPATEAFARTVKGFTPQLLHLKNVAQGRILSGFSQGLQAASPLLKKFEPAVRKTSAQIGALAIEAGGLARELGTEMSRILMTNVSLIRDVGRSGMNMAVVFVRILDAARPLTAWLGRMALGWSKSAMASTNAAAKSGKLAAFFERTRAVLTRVFSITGDLARGLMGVGRAASGMGGDLLKSVDAASARFAAFTNSVSGQRQLRQFFADAEPVIRQTAGLVGDIAGAFARLSVGANGGLAPLIGKLREIVPVLERVLIGTTAAFGPALVDLIVAFAQAFEPLAGSSGPLVLLVQGMTMLARAATWIATSVPGGSAALSTLFGLFAVSQAVGMASFVSGLFGAGRGITAIKTTATAAKGALVAFNATTIGTRIGLAALSVQAGIIAGATTAWTAAQWLLNAAMAANPVVLIVLAVIALAAAFYLAYTKVEWFRNGVNNVLSWLKDNWPTVLAILTGPVGLAVLAIVRNWDRIKSAARSVVGFVREKFNSMVNFIKSIPGRVAGLGGRMFSGLAAAASRVVSAIADRFRQLIDFVRRVPGAIGDIIKSAPGAVGDIIGGAASKVGLASGGSVVQGGWAVVGERGPELLRLPGASTVFDAGQTAMALPAPAPVRSPRVRQRPGQSAGERVDVHVQVGPTTLRIGDRDVGEATGRAVTTHTARKR